MDALKHQESTVAADLLGHKLEASTSREDVHKMMHEVLDARAELREAKKKAKFRGRVIGLGLVVLVLGFAACLLASYLGIKITKDTKHKRESGTESGTEVLETSDGKPITTTQTVYEHTGDEKMCALLGADPENIPNARSLGGLRDITFTYQGETSQSVLHMHVGLIKYDVPDDPEDDEAIIGEVASVSGRYSVVLAQSGAVSISEDGKLFATGKVCDVTEHERRRLDHCRRLVHTGLDPGDSLFHADAATEAPTGGGYNPEDAHCYGSINPFYELPIVGNFYSSRNCFPAEATATLADGSVKAMRDLQLGDAVLDATGGFSPVYFFSHADAAVTAPFVRLELAASGDVLTLSPDHYVPVDGVPIYAKDVRVGDAVARWDGAAFETDVVASKADIVAEGLYNPYTLSGTIVVDGVLASCHSSWILDGVLPPRVAAPVYQAIFAVPRAAYKLLGARGMEEIFRVGNDGATASVASQTAALFAVVAVLAASTAAVSKAALRL